MHREVEYEAEPRDRIGPLASWAIAVSGLAIAAALFLSALRPPLGFAPAGPIGSPQTVTLTNGQVYFGRLKSIEGGAIVLTGVFDAVTTTDATTQQRTTKLVSRQAANWHGPLDMAIPRERILFTETIGPDSTVSKTMAANAAGK